MFGGCVWCWGDRWRWSLISGVFCCVFQVYPEPSSQKTIFSSVVFCIHRKEGCDWTGELRKLKVISLAGWSEAFPASGVSDAPAGMHHAVSEQFQYCFSAVSVLFQSNFKAISEQFQSNFRAVSEQFQSSFRAVSDGFWSNFFWSSPGEFQSSISRSRVFRRSMWRQSPDVLTVAIHPSIHQMRMVSWKLHRILTSVLCGPCVDSIEGILSGRWRRRQDSPDITK